MELGQALLIVSGSYISYLLVWRRIRAVVGRARGPDLGALGAFDVDALVEESELVSRTAGPEAAGLIQEIQIAARRVQAMSDGLKRRAAAEEGLRAFRRLGASTSAAPTWSVLGAHFLVVRLSLLGMEWGEVVARRELRRALSLWPDSAPGHLVRAHLEAWLGHGEAAADHLARALFYAKGDPFYARPIVASPCIARLRPALDQQARRSLKSFGRNEQLT